MNNLPKIQKKNKNGKLNGYLLFARELAGRKTFPGKNEKFQRNKNLIFLLF